MYTYTSRVNMITPYYYTEGAVVRKGTFFLNSSTATFIIYMRKNTHRKGFIPRYKFTNSRFNMNSGFLLIFLIDGFFFNVFICFFFYYAVAETRKTHTLFNHYIYRENFFLQSSFVHLIHGQLFSSLFIFLCLK